MSTTEVHQDRPRTEVPDSTQYLLGRAYANALELDPDGDVEAIGFRVRIALRIAERIEDTCGWTDTVRKGFRHGAMFDPLDGTDVLLAGRERLVA